MLKSTVADPTSAAAMQVTLPGDPLRESPARANRPLLCDQLVAWSDQHRRWLYLATLVVYLAAFNGQWRVEPDAALYLSIGRNISDGKGFTYLNHANTLAYPGWPYLIAATFKLFGSSTLVPVHLLMMLMAWGALAATYRVFFLHCGRPTAVVVTVGAALTKTFFAYGFELWSDMPFTLGVMTFLAGYEGVFRKPGDVAPSHPSPGARWYDWALLVAGLGIAIEMRPTMWPLLIAVAGTILIAAIKDRMHWRTIAGIAAGFILLVAALLCLDPRRSSRAEISDAYEQHLLIRVTSSLHEMIQQAIVHNAPELLSRAASDVLFQVRLGPFNVVLSLVVLSLGAGLLRHRVLWGLWFCLLAGTILLILPLDRYFLPVIPLLIFAWWEALVWISHNFQRQWGNAAFAGLMMFGIGMNASKIGGIIMQQRSPAFLHHFNRGTYATIPQLAQAIHDNVSDDAVVLVEAPYGRVAAYLSRRIVTNAPSTPVSELLNRPVYVIEPAGADIRDRLQEASLTEGPALVTIDPPADAGPNAVPLSLHQTFRATAHSSLFSP